MWNFDNKAKKEEKVCYVNNYIFIEYKPREKINTIHNMSTLFLRNRQSTTIVLCKIADEKTLSV